MSDHSGWPLWDEDGATGPEDWPNLSGGLKRRLQAWEGYWARNFHHVTGWSPGTEASYVRQGKALRVEVARELGLDCSVTLHV